MSQPEIQVTDTSPQTNENVLTAASVPLKEQNPSKDLSGKVSRRTDEAYFSYGGHADVYKGDMVIESGQTLPVAIKVFRGLHIGPQTEREAIRRRLNRESWLWSGLEHKNILPFLGICSDSQVTPSPALISPYCSLGNVAEYCVKNAPLSLADKTMIVRGIAQGLEYLHSNNVVHGDLKPTNVVMQDGRPQICDFGCSRILEQRGYTTTYMAGTAQYTAPELHSDGTDSINPDSGTLEVALPPGTTKQSDVFSFSMLMLEIFSGKSPFGTLHDYTVIVLLQRGKRPVATNHPVVPMTVWPLLEELWRDNPAERKTMDVVVTRLELL